MHDGSWICVGCKQEMLAIPPNMDVYLGINVSYWVQLTSITIFSIKMFLQSRILFIHGLVCVLIGSVVALQCDKLSTTNDNTATGDRVFNEGVYHVRTTLKTSSAEVQELVTSLKGISDVIFNRRSFTATLKPKHIKKVSV